MKTSSEEFLLKAIHSEIAARDVYRTISNKIAVEEGRRMMAAMAEEEEGHRTVLASRYLALTGTDYDYDPEMKTGPDFSFIEKSSFSYTDALEGLKLALGAEIDAIRFYSTELGGVSEQEDKQMLKSLIRFEKKHKKMLTREIKRMEKQNHWELPEGQ